jgi:hypothetical protein
MPKKKSISRPTAQASCASSFERRSSVLTWLLANVLDGTIIGRNMKRHRHQEFIRFLNEIDAHVP